MGEKPLRRSLFVLKLYFARLSVFNGATDITARNSYGCEYTMAVAPLVCISCQCLCMLYGSICFIEALLDFTASEWLENSATAFLLFQIGSGAAQSSTEIGLPWQEKISGDAE